MDPMSIPGFKNVTMTNLLSWPASLVLMESCLLDGISKTWKRTKTCGISSFLRLAGCSIRTKTPGPRGIRLLVCQPGIDVYLSLTDDRNPRSSWADMGRRRSNPWERRYRILYSCICHIPHLAPTISCLVRGRLRVCYYVNPYLAISPC